MIPLLFVCPAMAQYIFNPSNADEQIPGIRYFGAAKDANGAMLSDATIVIESGNTSIVLVTDAQGRFHQKLPFAMTADRVAIRCFKSGYRSVKLLKRPGIGPKPTVQVDCVLQRDAAG